MPAHVQKYNRRNTLYFLVVANCRVEWNIKMQSSVYDRSSVQDPYILGGISASSFFFIASVVDLVIPSFFSCQCWGLRILSGPVLSNNLRCAVPSRPKHLHTRVSEGEEGCRTRQYYKVRHPWSCPPWRPLHHPGFISNLPMHFRLWYNSSRHFYYYEASRGW